MVWEYGGIWDNEKSIRKSVDKQKRNGYSNVH